VFTEEVECRLCRHPVANTGPDKERHLSDHREMVIHFLVNSPYEIILQLDNLKGAKEPVIPFKITIPDN
jgi:hypothetical protein